MLPYAISLKTILLRLLRAIVAMYVVLFAIQRWLVFPAYMANVSLGYLKTPEQYNLLGFTEVSLTASDGVRILGWSHPPSGGMPVILYLHGNAMHIAARMPRFEAFANKGYGVFALSYRGYGRSEGSPSEQGLYKDARAAMEWIRRTYAHPKIILYGESLGTGVATEMATEYPVYGVVLQSAYTSVADVAAETYWFLPGTHSLVRDKFDSLSRMAALHCPVLIMHGDLDDQIPLAHGKALAATANEPKRFIVVHGAGHMNIPDTIVVNAIKDFFVPENMQKHDLAAP